MCVVLNHRTNDAFDVRNARPVSSVSCEYSIIFKVL